MKRELVHELTATFEGHAQQTETGVDYWLARDLQHLLGYAEWRNFGQVILKAKTACEVSGNLVADHFVDVTKMVDLGSGSQRQIDDFMLTRYACYLIAQNGDPNKEQIAFAQTYFALQTRRAELIEERLLEAERVAARRKLTATEKELSSVIFQQTGGNQDFALIRSKGDYALFSKSTQAMKAEWKVPDRLGNDVFERCAGVFHAFAQLEARITEALDQGRARQAAALMFGERFDSLGTVLGRVLRGEDVSARAQEMSDVDRYLVLLCAVQLGQKVRRERAEFWSEYEAQGAALLQRLGERQGLRTALAGQGDDEMPAFMDWFDKWFLARAEPVARP